MSAFYIYHYFFRGLYQFKTNDFSEIYKAFYRDAGDILSEVVTELISRHEYHLVTLDGERYIDIMVESIG